jgi:hypothetical protein
VAKIPWGEWADKGEIPGRVVRVEFEDEGAGTGPRPERGAGGRASRTRVAVEWVVPPPSPS